MLHFQIFKCSNGEKWKVSVSRPYRSGGVAVLHFQMIKCSNGGKCEFQNPISSGVAVLHFQMIKCSNGGK